MAVKRVLDANVKAQVSADGKGVNLANVKMSMNPFDEIAVEEAVRLKEKGVVTEIIAVSCGEAKCQETLRTAMAIGADRGILVETAEELQPLAVAKLLKALVDQEQARADRAGQAGHRRRLQPDRPDAGRAAGRAASHLCVEGRDRRRRGRGDARGRRRPGDGEVPPARRGHHRPAPERAALRRRLPNIMKAKKKPLATTTPAELGVDIAPRLTTVQVAEPPKRGAGIKVPDVAALIDKLKNEAKVI